jgi:hypothetical protein
MNNLPLIDPPAIVKSADDLATLAARIKDREAKAGQDLLEHAHQQGLDYVLARRQAGPRKFAPWCRERTPDVGMRTIYRYLKIAENWDVIRATMTRITSVADALRLVDDQEGGEGEEAPQLPADPQATVEELRRELWTRQWRAAGVQFPAATGGELREFVKANKPGFPFGGDLPDTDEAWDGALYRLLAERAAAYLIRNGGKNPLLPPGDLSPDGRKWEGRLCEQHRVGTWDIFVARHAGGFLNWGEKAGIFYPKGTVGIRLPEKPFADMKEAARAKEALREDVGRDKDKPFSDEDAANLLKVDPAHLPAALFHYLCGHVFSFFSPLTDEATQGEMPGEVEAAAAHDGPETDAGKVAFSTPAGPAVAGDLPAPNPAQDAAGDAEATSGPSSPGGGPGAIPGSEEGRP